MSDEISEILEAYNANTLREMAEVAHLDITKSGKKLPKTQLITKLQSEFFTTKRIQASLGQLNERERAVLNRLLLWEKQIPTRSFKRELLRAGLVTEGEEPKQSSKHYYYRELPYAEGYVGYPTRPKSTVFEDVIARLTYYGLVFSQGATSNMGGANYKLQFHPGSTLYIPKVIRQHLPKPEPLPETVSDWQPAHIHTADPIFFYGIFIFIGILCAGMRCLCSKPAW